MRAPFHFPWAVWAETPTNGSPQGTVRQAMRDATDPSVSRERRRELAAHPEAVVRLALVGNARVGKEDLDILSTDAHPLVREAVAWCRKTSMMTRRRMYRDAHPAVRMAVAGIPLLSPAEILILSCDADERVRARVALRSDVPAKLLCVMLLDGCDAVAGNALSTFMGGHVETAEPVFLLRAARVPSVKTHPTFQRLAERLSRFTAHELLELELSELDEGARP